MSVIIKPGFEFEPSEILDRIQLRIRALIYAEYLHFSQRLMNNQETFILCESAWRIFVRVIELHLITNENPRFLHIRVNDFEPKWMFFPRPDTRLTTLEPFLEE